MLSVISRARFLETRNILEPLKLTAKKKMPNMIPKTNLLINPCQKPHLAKAS